MRTRHLTDYPRVSIVTPSFNSGRFLRETIDSVLAQDYPNLEYLVMDGGSTDETVDVLRSYGNRVRWISQRDQGQADAVNKGFGLSSGEIFAFLNADDLYVPGAVTRAVEHLQRNPHAAGIYGEALHVDVAGNAMEPYPTEDFSLARLNYACIISQPACFLRSHAFRRAQGLNVDLHLTLDYDLWIRIGKEQPLVRVHDMLAHSRMHADAKTLRQRGQLYKEAVTILRRHFQFVPYSWAYDYASYKLGCQLDVSRRRRSPLLTFPLSLALGAFYNRGRFGRFLEECWGELRKNWRPFTDRRNGRTDREPRPCR